MRFVRRSHRFLVAAASGLFLVGAASSPAAAMAGGPLPDTGSSVQWWLIIAIAVIAVGAGLYGYSRWSSKRSGGGE